MRLYRFAYSSTLVVGAVWLCGCVPPSSPPGAIPPPVALSVQVIQPRRAPITRVIQLPASLRPAQQAVLYAKTGGYLKTIRVDRGDRVKAGDLLAEIEAPELLADVARSTAEVLVAKTDYHRLSDTFGRAPDLVVPLTVETARAKLEMAQATAQRNETLLGFTRLTAPFDGLITKRWADLGALIPAATSGGSQANGAVVTLMDISVIRVEVNIPEMEVPGVHPGLAAEVQVEELPGKKFVGQVSRVAYSLDDATKSMPTEIDLKNPDELLRPGMFAIVKLTVGEKPSALVLPLDTLVTEKAKTSVFLWADGKARKMPVKVGFVDEKAFEVVEGIAPEATVILTGKLPLADGTPVQRTDGK